MQQASTAKNETKLPRAVLERSARIAQYEADRKAAAQPTPPEPPATPEGNPVASAPAAPAVPTPKPQVDRENDPTYWKQRFQATAGTLDAVKRERIAERQEWNTRFNELQAQIRDLQAQLTAATPDDLSAFFSAADIEKYGEDQCRAMLRTAQATTKAAVDAELQPIRERQAREAEDAKKDRLLEFDVALTALVPNWKEIDAEENLEWHAWLREIDPDTGEPRNTALANFVKKGNAIGTAGVFTRFLNSAVVPDTPPPPPPTPPKPPVAPPAAGHGDSSPPPPPIQMGSGYPSPAEIKEHYKQAKLGKLKDADRVAFDARLKLPRPQ